MTETLGFTPEWNAERREITVGSPQGEVTMRIGSPEYTVTSPSGVTSVFTFEPPEIVNDRTQVPFAFFREIYGL